MLKELNEAEFMGFKLLSDVLAHKAILNEEEKIFVSSLIATCINDRSFCKLFNQAYPKLLALLENKEGASQAADMVLTITFRSRHLDKKLTQFIERAVANCKKIRYEGRR